MSACQPYAFFMATVRCQCWWGMGIAGPMWGEGCSDGSKGDAPGMPRPLTAQNCLNFVQFFGKLGKIICWCPPPPPRVGASSCRKSWIRPWVGYAHPLGIPTPSGHTLPLSGHTYPLWTYPPPGHTNPWRYPLLPQKGHGTRHTPIPLPKGPKLARHAHPPTPSDRQIPVENIILPQLPLWAVIIA